MNNKECKNVIDEIFMEIFKQKCPIDIDDLLAECAFDIRLPNKVIDAVTGDETWASSINSNKYISQTNMEKYDEYKGWMRPKKEISSLDDIIKLWDKVNYTTTERVYDSINVSKSDTIYNCENIYRSQDCRSCKNTIFSDGCGDSEYIIACQRSSNCNYSMRVDDSNSCSNSYNVICSSKISNSFFIQDANSLHECMFCSHIANRRYCIANMQFEKEEYMEIKAEVEKWIINQFRDN
jgi:hypothetical protein